MEKRQGAAKSYKPRKRKELKVTSEGGNSYATVDGSTMWKVDDSALKILGLCDGKTSVDDIIARVARKIRVSPEEVAPVVEKVLKELASMKFID